MQTLTLSIPSISCNHCVNTIQMEVGEISGVLKVMASSENKTAIISFDAPATEKTIRTLLDEINYSAE